jgi:hypothetical protein
VTGLLFWDCDYSTLGFRRCYFSSLACGVIDNFQWPLYHFHLQSSLILYFARIWVQRMKTGFQANWAWDLVIHMPMPWKEGRKSFLRLSRLMMCTFILRFQNLWCVGITAQLPFIMCFIPWLGWWSSLLRTRGTVKKKCGFFSSSCGRLSGTRQESHLFILSRSSSEFWPCVFIVHGEQISRTAWVLMVVILQVCFNYAVQQCVSPGR